ncbi:protein phosphatase 1, regulatory (inhibitor) subunit 14Aa [Lampris incognitus]|uniref:protein phosphatase 1, regulatory (inhibitor) subunit 14Aa n=1 Tax=Lampris incognitus TaxID=2546036 RepID=UPI0024B5325A|nr:protein phosphatase 1, regulatory (inhibitor) subunit 14Aa [Lampris incognitus]
MEDTSFRGMQNLTPHPPPQLGAPVKEPVKRDMAAERVGALPEDRAESADTPRSPDSVELFQGHGCHIQRRQARVTVKYNRKELQRRLDVEKWIDDCLDQLYLGKEDDVPEEVNIDDLLELPSDEERVRKLQALLHSCGNNTETFIRELVGKLEGLHKQEELQSEGIEHPVITHNHYRHEPYHFNSPHHHPQPHPHTHHHNQTL